MQPIAFCDLDGCLVDFNRGAFELHGRSLPPREITWCFWEQMGLTAEQFWQPFDAGFWTRLQWTPEGKELLAAIEDVFPGRVHLLTSAGAPGAPAGKREWVARNAPRYEGRLNMESQKYLYAHPYAVLVDDYEVNVEAFRAAGGEAVLVPRAWNSRREETDSEGRFSVASLRDDILKASYRAMEAKPTSDMHRYPVLDSRILSLLPPRRNGKPYTSQQVRKWVREGVGDKYGVKHKLAASLTVGSDGSRFYTTTRNDMRSFISHVGRMFTSKPLTTQ